MNTKHSIETVSGKFVDFENPTVESIDLDDIAWGLSRQPRFCGQTKGEFPLSVAQHSINVAGIAAGIIVHEGLQNLAIRYFENKSNEQMVDIVKTMRSSFRNTFQHFIYPAFRVGLYHDGSEALLCDVPTPAKRLPMMDTAYSPIELRLMTKIYEKAGCLEFSELDIIKNFVHFADAYCLSVEAWNFLPSKGLGWRSTIDIFDEHKTQPYRVMLPREAYESFNEVSSFSATAVIDFFSASKDFIKV